MVGTLHPDGGILFESPEDESMFVEAKTAFEAEESIPSARKLLAVVKELNERTCGSLDCVRLAWALTSWC